MIVVDTNVVSEVLKAKRDPSVVAWLDRQMAETMFLTSISLAELLLGIALLPDGRRKRGLGLAVADLTNRLFSTRILHFDEAAARSYAALVSRARAAGRVIAVVDGQIAAIAVVHGFAVATRDFAPFVAAGVKVINPWEAGT
jgi:predicted nucleic acid-binding protein